MWADATLVSGVFPIVAVPFGVSFCKFIFALDKRLTSSGDTKATRLRLLERFCNIKELWIDPKYRNELSYVKLWLKYVSTVSFFLASSLCSDGALG